MSEHIKRGTLCSQDSLEANEEMYGTATTVETWLALEYNGRWSGDAFRDSKIPDAVKTAIGRYLKGFPNPCLQLVKKEKRSGDGIKLFIAHTREKHSSIREITLARYEDLIDEDIHEIVSNKSSEIKEPVFLICTNGEHDKCCGKFGMPVYLGTAEGAYGQNTWQTTHIGGHRFASTFVCLPHGLYYGRVREGKTAEEIFGEYKNGRVDPASYRGRSCYSAPVQAAEYFLRKETGIREISAFYLESAAENNGEFIAEFKSGPEEKTYEIKLRKLESTLKTLKSCGDKQRSFVPQYILLSVAEK